MTAPTRLTRLLQSGRRGWPGWRTDLAVVLLAGLIQIGGTYLASRQQFHHHDRPLDAAGFTLLAIGPAALIARRRHPSAVLAVIMAATLMYWEGFGRPVQYPRGPVFVALIIAFFTVAVRGSRWAPWLAVAAGWVLFTLLGPIATGQRPMGLAGALALGAWLLVLVTVAEVVRARRERAQAAARTHEEETRRRVSEDRLQLAQELHDVLAHSISLINVQAGVALHLMDEQPEQARTALAAIKQTSKEALGELRGMLGVLRQGEPGEAPRAPAPGLGRLDDLVAGANAAGITVTTRTEGEPRGLSAGVDLAAFRIVQEALTNVARHAGPASATVTIRYGQRELAVRVDDDGHGVPPDQRRHLAGPAPGGSNGIRGMRERAEALGGQLVVGSRPGGGFRVEAVLPLDDSDPEPGTDPAATPATPATPREAAAADAEQAAEGGVPR